MTNAIRYFPDMFINTKLKIARIALYNTQNYKLQNFRYFFKHISYI